MDILDEEILALWKALATNDVQYIMVGGFALNLHGHHRTTGDMDIWIKDTVTNRKALRKTLADIEVGDFESIETMDFIPGWSGIRLNSGFELDIMTYLKGFEQNKFDESFKLASTAIIADIPVRFLHINELISAKLASSREKDLIDIIALKKIRQARDE